MVFRRLTGKSLQFVDRFFTVFFVVELSSSAKRVVFFIVSLVSRIGSSEFVDRAIKIVLSPYVKQSIEIRLAGSHWRTEV